MFEHVLAAIQDGCFDVPFYQKRLQKSGIRLSGITSLEQFLKVPFTLKDDLRTTSPYSRTNVSHEEIFGIFSSNGTTGKKTFYVYNYADRETQAKFVRTYYSAIGMKAGGLGAVLAPVGTPVMGHCMMWQFQAMRMGMTLCPEPSPENILELLENLPITDVATLPQVASFLAARPEWRDTARRSTVERLILGGDFLSSARRRLLEDTWDAKAYNSFGMSEAFGPIGNECTEQNGFHYIDDDLYLEIISPDTGLPVDTGEIGIGVYTTLWHKGFPLLRYWSNDLMRIHPEPCKCGSPLPRFDYCGRRNDCVRLKDGSWATPREVEEITLPGGLLHCQIRLPKNEPAAFLYDESGPAPTAQMLSQLKDLLHLTQLLPQPLPLGKMDLRGLKPRYLVEC